MTDREKLVQWVTYTYCIANDDPICYKCPFAHNEPCVRAVEKALLKILTSDETPLLSKEERRTNGTPITNK